MNEESEARRIKTLERLLSKFGDISSKVTTDEGITFDVVGRYEFLVTMHEKGYSISLVFKIPESFTKQFEDLTGLREHQWKGRTLDIWISKVIPKVVSFIEKEIEVKDYEVLNNELIRLNLKEKLDTLREVGKKLMELVNNLGKIEYELSQKSVFDFVVPSEIRKTLVSMALENVTFVAPCDLIQEDDGVYIARIPVTGIKTMINKPDKKIHAVLRVEPVNNEIVIRVINKQKETKN